MRPPITALVLAALALGTATTTTSSTAPPESSAPSVGEPCTGQEPTNSVATGAELPAWQTLEITDVEGVTFTLADCLGTPVLVELFATWCSNCRQQLPKTQEAAVTMGDRAEVLALSVETDIDPGDVARYAEDNEFPDIRFAVISAELLAAFVDEFGHSAANPPSTPKIVIDAAGVAGEMTTGQESTEDLVAQLTAAAHPGGPATTAP